MTLNSVPKIQDAIRIFSKDKRVTHCPIKSPIKNFSQYVYRPEVAYSPESWPEIWNGHEIKIDEFLCQAKKGMKLCPIIFQEDEFVNISYRLVIDPRKALDLPMMGRGTMISFNNCNSQGYRYIIDSCVFSNCDVAFLKVVSLTPTQEVCGLHSRRPPFILQIPTAFCHRRYHPTDPYKCSVDLEDISVLRHRFEMSALKLDAGQEELADQGLWGMVLGLFKHKW